MVTEVSPCRISLGHAGVALDVDAIWDAPRPLLEKTWAARCDDAPLESTDALSSSQLPVPRVQFRYGFRAAAPNEASGSLARVRNLCFKWLPGGGRDRFIEVGGCAQIILRPGKPDEIQFSADNIAGVPEQTLVSCLDPVLVHAALLQGRVAATQRVSPLRVATSSCSGRAVPGSRLSVQVC